MLKQKKWLTLAVITFIGLSVLAVALLLVNRAPDPRHESNQSPPPAVSEPQNTTQFTAEPDKALEALLASQVVDRPGKYGIYVQELNGDKRFAGYQANEKIIAASTFKLFLIYAVLEKAEKTGSFNLSTPLAGGTVLSCIESLLVISSDACAFVLGKLVGWSALNSRLHEAGFTNTNINNYTETGDTSGDKYTTAYDEALLLDRLANGTLLNQEHTEVMTGFMKRQIHRQRIAGGLPKGVEVASKPGFIYEIENDSGIVYGPKSTYVVVLLSDGSEPAVLAELSASIYKYLHGL